MKNQTLKKAYKHNRRKYLCGGCDWVKADRKYRETKLKGRNNHA